jgi:hypothetical protein
MSIKADDYYGAKGCGCRADEYDLNYWDHNKRLKLEEARKEYNDFMAQIFFSDLETFIDCHGVTFAQYCENAGIIIE